MQKICCDTSSTTKLVGGTVYSTNQSAVAAVTGIYTTMVNSTIAGGSAGISLLMGLYADELSLYPTTNILYNQVFKNSLLNSSGVGFWSQFYNCLYQSNAAIEGLSASDDASLTMREQLIGEAKFVRAFCNFYLIEYLWRYSIGNVF